MTNETKRTIESIITEADIETQIEIYNTYCDVCNLEERLWSMDELDELLAGMKPTEVISMLGENFNLNHDWFYTDAYGKLISTDRPCSDIIDYYVGDIAEMIWYDHTDLGCSYIRENMLHDGLWSETAAD